MYVRAYDHEGYSEAESARVRRGAYVVVAGSILNSCASASPVTAYVPNNVELDTVQTDGITSIGGPIAQSLLSLGATFARVQQSHGEDGTLNVDDNEFAEFDGSFRRVVFMQTSDHDTIAQAACSLATQYDVAEYGSAMINTTLCLKPTGAACVIDTQCQSNSEDLLCN
jgi:hypothetical protein